MPPAIFTYMMDTIGHKGINADEAWSDILGSPDVMVRVSGRALTDPDLPMGLAPLYACLPVLVCLLDYLCTIDIEGGLQEDDLIPRVDQRLDAGK